MIRLVVAVAVATLVLWAGFVALIWWRRPDDLDLRDAARIVPDAVRLVGRLAADRSIGRGVRVRLWLLIGYLALPFDLVPDVIPVIGHADDLIAIALVLRSVLRHAGPSAIERNWPGTPAARRQLERLCRLPVDASGS